MISIIAQSKKIARTISYVLNADNDFDGYFASDKYYITWTYGEMVEIETPRGQPNFWQRNTSFPQLPSELKLVPAPQKFEDERTPNQLNIVKRLLAKSEKVIIALDPTLRGELIARYLLRYLEYDAPVYRAVLNDLMNNTISQAIYKPELYDTDNIKAETAELANQADWLISTNIQRALAFGFGMSAFPISRTAISVLGMVAARENEIKDFSPETWIVPTVTFKDRLGETHSAICMCGYDEIPTEVSDQLKAGAILKVTSVKRDKKPVPTPCLFNIVNLQAEAAKRFGFTPYKTFKIAYALYENKRISFPGYSTRGISRRKYEEIKGILKTMIGLKCFEHLLEEGYKPSRGNRVKDDAAITHGIIVTEYPPVGMTKDEEKIYFLIVERMFAAFSKPVRQVFTTYEMECGDLKFYSYSNTVTDHGFARCIRDVAPPVEKPEIVVEEGDELQVLSTGSLTKKDKAPKPYTDYTLIKDVASHRRSVFKALSPMDIGFLLGKGYLSRNLLGEYSLTESGRVLNSLLEDTAIHDPNMNQAYDDMIIETATGYEPEDDFIPTVHEAVKNISRQILSNEKLFNRESISIKCPHCGETVLVFGKIAKCTNPSCGFHLFRQIQGLTLNIREVRNLLASGATTSCRGFADEKGKPFTGRVILESDGSPTVVPAKQK